MILQELQYAEHAPVEWSPAIEARINGEVNAAMRLVAWCDREPQADDTNWKSAVEERLATLLRRRRGWDGYNASPISAAVAAFALHVLRSIMQPSTPPPSIVPAHGGGLQLEWHLGGLDIEFMIYRPFEAELSVDFSDGRDPIEEEPVSSDLTTFSWILAELA